MGRWGGFRKGRKRYTENWDDLKSNFEDNFRTTTVANTPAEFSYVEAQGIWTLKSTIEFPKSNKLELPPATPGEAQFYDSGYIDQVDDTIAYDRALLYSTAYSFVVPANVTAISAVAIGGGGGGGGGTTVGGSGGGGGHLAYINDYPVTPGDTLTVYAGLGGYDPTDGTTGSPASPSAIIHNGSIILFATAGGSGSVATGGTTAVYDTSYNTGDASFAGGAGGSGGASTGGGGGGAAGYSADGNTGLGGSGMFGGEGNQSGLGGGGVGWYGEGTSGIALGEGGSGAAQAGTGSSGGPGTDFGGGGGGGNDDSTNATTGTVTDYNGARGASGGVRIVWGAYPGERLFPSTGVSATESNGNITIYGATPPM